MKPHDVTSNLRLAGLVKRYHTWPTISAQTVAEHSWQVYRIYYEVFGAPDYLTTQYIMMHDVGEIVTGDLPYPIKAQNPKIKEEIDNLEEIALGYMKVEPIFLVPEEALRVKICHMIEMMEFGLHEEALGNRYGKPISDRCDLAARELIATLKDSSIQGRLHQYVDRSRRRLV